MFGNWTFGTLVFTVMVITVTLKVNDIKYYTLSTNHCTLSEEAVVFVMFTTLMVTFEAFRVMSGGFI